MSQLVGGSLANCGVGGKPKRRRQWFGAASGYDAAMTPLRPSILFGIVASMACGTMLGIMAFWVLTDFANKVRDEYMLLSVVREVGDAYIEEVPRAVLIDNAIRGVVAGLDDHSAYLDKQALATMEDETSGRFGGIGISLGLVDGYFTVISPLEGAPAAAAGIVAGDRLVQVDHVSLKGRTLNDTVYQLRGEPGTDVHVRVRRPAGQSLDFDLTRDTITVPSADGRLLAPGFGYVKVTQFNDATADNLARVIEELGDDGPLAGLVMDLRNNPGGLLNAAVDVADAFLTDGVIVSTDGRLPDSERRYPAAAGDLLDGAPVAVLINGGSASASEIVAAALKDHGRATLLGTQSYGKGSVQSVMYFQDERAIKLTTARYLTPTGDAIDSGGVVPDIAVPRADDESRADYDERLLAEALKQLRGNADVAANAAP